MQNQIRLNRSIASLISIGLVAFLAIGASSGHAQAPPPLRAYQLTDLGVLPSKKANCSLPAAINDQGMVAGTSGMTAVDETAFLYDPKQPKGLVMQDLSRNYGGISHGFGINGVGDVVGDSTFGTADSCHAVIFKYGKILDLGTLKGTVSSQARGINASGMVVGFCFRKPDDSSSNRAFLWTPSLGMVNIGTLGGAAAQAFAVSDGGLITGTSEIGESSRGQTTTHAFIYNPFSLGIRKSMRDLGTLGGIESVGTAINGSGHIVGYSTLDPTNDRRVHAFLYDGSKMHDLGALETWIDADQSYALGVNLIDQVVGYGYTMGIRNGAGDPPVRQTAFIYTNGRMWNLNELLGTTTEPYWLHAATAINNNGQIVAIAEQLNTNELHAVLLTP